jgi:hypothetical protein
LLKNTQANPSVAADFSLTPQKQTPSIWRVYEYSF